MKLLFITVLLYSCCTVNTTNANHMPIEKLYPLAVSFGSMCCGTASDSYLKLFITDFNKINNTKITADVAKGCGREGEFTVLINLPEMTNSLKEKFTSMLNQIVTTEEEKNRKADASSGGMEVKTDVKSTDFSYCRLGITKWL